MDYTVWIDSEHNSHYIGDMDEKYINNCIMQLKLVIKAYRIGGHCPIQKSSNPYDDDIMHRNWAIDHAVNYLHAFEDELNSRIH